jgi:hypothetical protein
MPVAVTLAPFLLCTMHTPIRATIKRCARRGRIGEMSTTTLIIIILVVLLLFGGGGFWYRGRR